MANTDLSDEKSSSEENFRISYYALLYIDVLNQREKLSKIIDLPETEEEKESFTNLLRDTYGVIDGLANLFDSAIPRIGSAEDLLEVPEDYQEQYKRIVGEPIDRTLFSDSMLYYISLDEGEGAVPAIRILELMRVAAFVMAGALYAEVACRGGLEIGIAAKFRRVGIYGPALYKAYSLENQIAQYPRIVIGAELVGYLEQSAKDSQTMSSSAARRVFAKKCLSIICEDTDGAFILDYAHKSIQEFHPYCKMFLEGAFKFAIKEWNRFTEEKNHKLAARYFLLVNYLDTRLAIAENSIED